MLPVLGLPVFWLWPLSEAVPVYGVILALSILVYVYVIRAMRHPVETGAEQILHSIGKVIEAGAKDTRVRVHSEIWRAVSTEKLKPGDMVEIIDRWLKASSPQARRFTWSAEWGCLAYTGAWPADATTSGIGKR
jgi:membrane protein implicated in regulation of membrane protease activity